MDKTEETKENQQKEKGLLKRVEACLFLSANYLNIDELVRFTSINPLTICELINKLKKKYGENSGLIILEKEIGNKISWKMDVKPEFSFLINRLATGESEFTKAEQETLAIIAYKQPIKQSIVVKIRGNKAYDHIKHFIASNLIKARKLGRTLELTISDKFYDYFSISKKEKIKEEKIFKINS